MNILVTGGSGMVGSLLKDYIYWLGDSIKDKYWFISSKDYDLTDLSQVEKCFAERKYDRVIHLAAVVGGLYMNMNNNCKMLIDNLKININIIEQCHKNNIQRGIFCLSSCIYPQNPKKFPMTEEMLCSGEPHYSNEGYAYAKRMLYIMCKNYNKTYNREYICLSPVNLYGPYDNFNIENGHVIPSLIHRMYKTMNTIQPYTSNIFDVFGTGNAERQFLFSPDFVVIIYKILNSDVKEDLINVSNDYEYKIKDVVNVISKELNFNKENIKYNTQYSDGIIKKSIDNTLLKNLMEKYNIEHIFIDINDGIKLTIDWFLNYYEQLRK
jgi:GDP-L-fucose synthase